jgi:uncharacterized membrane protein
VQRWALVPAALLGAGVVLVALSLRQGGAQIAIIVVVPVLFGRSLEFAAGVLLLVSGLFCLPLAFEPAEEAEGPTLPGTAPGPSGGAGGLVLIGPVPIFFGSWRAVSTRTRVIAAIVGGVVLVVAVLVLLSFRG